MSSCGLIELKVTNYHHKLVNFDVPHALPFLVQWESTHKFQNYCFQYKEVNKSYDLFFTQIRMDNLMELGCVKDIW